MKKFFILPAIFFFNSLTNSYSQSNLRFSDGVLKNDFFEINLGNSWNLNSINDRGLNVISANLSHGISLDLLFTAEYNLSTLYYLDKKLEDDLNYVHSLGGSIIKSQYFIAANGSQACATHYELEKRGIKENYFIFHFDGTTSEYDGIEEEWLHTSILLTDYGFNVANLTFEEAKNIADKIYFTEGTIYPNKTIKEFSNLSIGDYYEMDNNTSNTDQDNEISLTRIFKNSAISFSITEDTNINVIENYYEFKNSTNAQYSLILDASQEITPAIAVGLNPMFNLTSDASYPAASMHVFSDSTNSNLDSWASNLQSTWKKSPNGMIFSSDYFTTRSGFQGISIIRETGITRDYYIGIDLSNSSWKSRNPAIASNSFLRLQISGFKDPIKDGFYPTILEISKSLDFNESITPSLPEISETNPDYGIASMPNIDRTVTDGPISFSIPSSLLIDWREAYIERGQTSKAQYNLSDQNQTISANIIATTENKFNTLEEWGAYKQLTWQNNNKGDLVSVKEFTNDFGFEGIAVVREEGSIRDFFIVLDLTTTEWEERYSSEANSSDDAWLRFHINGFQDPQNGGIYSSALAIANSINYDPSFIPNLENTFIEIDSNYTYNQIDLNFSIQDGPIKYLVKENTIVDFFNNYSESGANTEAKYNITPGNTDSFKTVSLNTENFYNDLEEWAYYQKVAWQNSDFGVLSNARYFTTDYNNTGIYLTRETNSTRDFKIAIDLSNESWKGRMNSNSDSNQNIWLKAEFTSSNNPLYNPIFDESLATAKSIHFIETLLPVPPIFREISPRTLFNAGRITNNWYISDWFGTFYENNNTSWIHHELLGWMYAIEITTNKRLVLA